MRRTVPALCAIVMLTAFMVPTLAVADLGQTCPEEQYDTEWSCEGPVKDGKRHGNWVMRSSDGDVFEGPFVDGKEHGNWVIRFADGGVSEGPYVDGKEHGIWVFHFPSGHVQGGPFVDGIRHGNWVLRHKTGRFRKDPLWTARSMEIGSYATQTEGVQKDPT